MEESQKGAIKRWFSDYHNVILLGIVLLVLMYRIFWFIKLGNQPIWYDEADYLNMANAWRGLYSWDINPVRPILLPLLLYGLLSIGIGEFGVRIVILLASVMIVPLTYYIGSKLLDKKTGLVAAFISAVFWSYNFYSFRILVDIIVAVLWLATLAMLLYAYHENKGWKPYLFAGILLGLAFLAKFSSIILVLVVSLYLIGTEKLNIFRNGKIWVFYAAALITVIPYFIWQKIAFGSPLSFLAAGTADAKARSFYQSLYDQTLFSVGLMKYALIICFVLGLILIIYRTLLLFDSSFKKGTQSNGSYLILLWLILSLLFFGWLNYGSYMDERYYFVFYPAIFLIVGKFISVIYDYVKKYNKNVALVVVTIILVLVLYQNIVQANQIIDGKKDSFVQLKLAGEYVKENTLPGERAIFIEEAAELIYYSERDALEAYNKTQLLENIDKYHPNYIVVSFYYTAGRPQQLEMIQFMLENQNVFQIYKQYGPYVNKEGTLPLAMVVKINYQ